MLPEEHLHLYRQFQQMLFALEANLRQANPDTLALRSQFLDAQQFFQLRIVSLELEGIDPADASKLYSYQVEINKQLRLLGTDVMFLQAARKSATAQQRQAQMNDRLQMLHRYCASVLGEDEPTR